MDIIARNKINLTKNVFSFLQEGTKEIITVHALKTDKSGLDKNTNLATVGFYIWNLNTGQKMKPMNILIVPKGCYMPRSGRARSFDSHRVLKP